MNYRALLLVFFILALAYFLPSGAQSSRAATPVTQQAQAFYRDLRLGDFGADVLALQKLLNQSGTIIAESGPGSPGNETDRFGAKTKKAVIAFQEKNRNEILTPSGLQNGTGYVGRKTRETLIRLINMDKNNPPQQQPAQQPAASTTQAQTQAQTNLDILLYYPSTYASTAGKTVTINGQGFAPLGNTLIFSKNGQTIHTITDITSSSGSSISFKVPSLANDRYTLSLANSSGTSKHSTFMVILDANNPVPPPKISRITPSDVTYGEPVTVYGENLVATNMIITNYGIIENATSSPDNTSITFTLKPFEDIPQIKTGTAPKQNLSIPVFVHIVNKNGVSDTKNPGTFTIHL
jgi:peptidoglycan hydrolase-like protein with peptidoglycan-binding domain